MGCDLCGASVGRVGRELLIFGSGLDCDFWDLGRWAVICVVRCWGWGGSVVCCLELDCDFWDLGGWAVISLAAMLGVGMEVLSGLGIV